MYPYSLHSLVPCNGLLPVHGTSFWRITRSQLNSARKEASTLLSIARDQVLRSSQSEGAKFLEDQLRGLSTSEGAEVGAGVTVVPKAGSRLNSIVFMLACSTGGMYIVLVGAWDTPLLKVPVSRLLATGSVLRS